MEMGRSAAFLECVLKLFEGDSRACDWDTWPEPVNCKHILVFLYRNVNGHKILLMCVNF